MTLIKNETVFVTRPERSSDKPPIDVLVLEKLILNMFRLLLTTMVASTGLIVSPVEASDYASEQLDMMRSKQIESSTSSVKGPSSPVMYMPPGPTLNPIIKAPQTPKTMKICWMVLEDQICSGDD